MITDRRSHAYTVLTVDTTPAYHRRRRLGAFFLGLWSILVVLRAPAVAEEGPPPLDVEVIGEVGAPAARVRELLLDLEGFGRWFPNTEEWEVLERSASSALIYGRLSLPWPVDDRDYVARYSWSASGAEPFRLVARAVVGAAPAAPDGVVRVEEMTTTWEVAPLGEGTRVRYVYRGSPGGALPDWVARIGWEMQTGILMDALEEELDRRRSSRTEPR